VMWLFPDYFGQDLFIDIATK